MFIFEILYNTNVAVSSVCSMNNVCSMQGFPCTWNRIEFQFAKIYTYILFKIYWAYLYSKAHTWFSFSFHWGSYSCLIIWSDCQKLKTTTWQNGIFCCQCTKKLSRCFFSPFVIWQYVKLKMKYISFFSVYKMKIKIKK